MRFAVDQVPLLAGALAGCRAVRASETRQVLSILATGHDVTEQTLQFEAWRTLALAEGLSEQLCSSDSGVSSQDARSVLTAHLRGVEANWRLAPRRTRDR